MAHPLLVEEPSDGLSERETLLRAPGLGPPWWIEEKQGVLADLLSHELILKEDEAFARPLREPASCVAGTPDAATSPARPYPDPQADLAALFADAGIAGLLWRKKIEERRERAVARRVGP